MPGAFLKVCLIALAAVVWTALFNLFASSKAPPTLIDANGDRALQLEELIAAATTGSPAKLEQLVRFAAALDTDLNRDGKLDTLDIEALLHSYVDTDFDGSWSF